MTGPIAAQAWQSALHVLLVRPAQFGYNAQTAPSNRFQRPPADSRDVAARAAGEFDALCRALRDAGVRLCIAEDSAQPHKPDAVFPNNWVSWHRDGTAVLYPLQALNRRPERRQDIMAFAESCAGFWRRRLVDLSARERDGRYLEGTGSLVLDHVHRVAYACRSSRTDESLLWEWSRLLDYEALIFDAAGSDGTALYHTNVMMAIGTQWAVVCSAAIAAADRSRVLARLKSTGRTIIEIGLPSLRAFAANVLELPIDGAPTRRVLVMSARAREALAAQGESWEQLSSLVEQIVAVPVPTIEAVGGGSVRCMLAEIPTVA